MQSPSTKITIIGTAFRMVDTGESSGPSSGLILSFPAGATIRSRGKRPGSHLRLVR